ncbi:hypothetical protein PHLCEN_2v10456 [Hermanssonia centrifuga]|uniref:Uncharacterized protein n=1 Tax=Hermanssonia centrifuga TaxID=98765 RepID=A0A2R6NMC8_9APHY|nr:hypothetical protein PHLCEN_2v10456 [Hermanssonia centrifuga]
MSRSGEPSVISNVRMRVSGRQLSPMSTPTTSVLSSMCRLVCKIRKKLRRWSVDV